MRRSIFIGFLVLAAIFGFALLFFDNLSSNFNPNMELGKITHLRGQAQAQSSGSSVWNNLENRQTIRDGDRLKTASNSDLTFKMPGHGQVQLLANSQVLLKKDMGKVLVTVQEGKIEVTELPQNDSLEIAEGGVRTSAKDYSQFLASRDRDIEIILPVTEVAEAQAKPILDNPSVPVIGSDNKEGQKSLSTQQAALRNKILAQNNFFYRCYSNLLQVDATAKGAIVINFQVEPKGQINFTEVVKSDFKNQDFINCILEVVKRTQFETFSGEAILSQVPLVFNPQR